MTIDHPGRFALLQRTLVELPRGGELAVACDAGCLWLTIDRDLRDFVLAPGDSLPLPAGCRVLAYAFDDSILTLRERQPQPCEPPRRRWFGRREAAPAGLPQPA
ncbi:MAG TPA: DUF2917 domain-containing protein [Ramlibacter sp.]|jgi:hypothetical protein|uniref:DUF2917 domain-containing protein n=1 Tax=Ramlibacter sp. TaxID=1917967 RepID=UPI002D5A1994|nr:DUF2917 domain-containing protein [Ramlibacter sp.]HZY17746.1 DUF2917 domain-containing protein [Ramlibacter sp.]